MTCLPGSAGRRVRQRRREARDGGRSASVALPVPSCEGIPGNGRLAPLKPSATHLVIIPTYNTGPALQETVRAALAAWRPVWVVVDGSTDGSDALLDGISAPPEDLRVLRHSGNQGKGAAVLTGARAADEAGFTHVLVFDADGQHPADRIPQFMAESAANPSAMIAGLPQFPGNAPGERVFGRKLANFWTAVDSGWCGPADVMFGMRVFPLRDLIAVMDSTRHGRRYDFECETAIRLAWRGVPVVDVPTPVRYVPPEEGGVSHYKYVRDNLRLVWLFLRLLPGGLRRWPQLLARRRAASARSASESRESRVAE
jgi:glycosyltransferase involved in cell wall biosynthesis